LSVDPYHGPILALGPGLKAINFGPLRGFVNTFGVDLGSDVLLGPGAGTNHETEETEMLWT